MSSSLRTRERRGQTAVEYALAITLISILAIVALLSLGPTIATIFTSVNSTVGSASGQNGGGGGGGGPTPTPGPYHPGTTCMTLDTDGDGSTDRDEITQHSDPNDNQDYPGYYVDTDGDGYADQDEWYWQSDINSAASPGADSDNDGSPDGFEVAVGSDPYDDLSNPWDGSYDADGDTWIDFDEARYGSDPNDNASLPVDTDGDGWYDLDETGFFNTNPNDDMDYVGVEWNIDTDLDGWNDWQEVLVGTDPNDDQNSPGGDTDGDGFSDWTEIYLCSDPGSAGSTPDSDGDGWSDEDEIGNGTDPNDDQDPAPPLDQDADVTQVIVTANPITVAKGADSTITVQLKNAAGQNVTQSGGTITLFRTPAQGSFSTVTDNNDGTYTATYTAGNAAGVKTITARLDGVLIDDNATVTVTAGPADAAVSYFINPSDPGVLMTGANSTVTLIVNDSDWNPVTGATVVMDTDLGTIGSVTDEGNGTYTATLSSPTSGLATVTATINGDPVSAGIQDFAEASFLGVCMNTDFSGGLGGTGLTPHETGPTYDFTPTLGYGPGGMTVQSTMNGYYQTNTVLYPFALSSGTAQVLMHVTAPLDYNRDAPSGLNTTALWIGAYDADYEDDWNNYSANTLDQMASLSLFSDVNYSGGPTLVDAAVGYSGTLHPLVGPGDSFWAKVTLSSSGATQIQMWADGQDPEDGIFEGGFSGAPWPMAGITVGSYGVNFEYDGDLHNWNGGQATWTIDQMEITASGC